MAAVTVDADHLPAVTVTHEPAPDRDQAAAVAARDHEVALGRFRAVRQGDRAAGVNLAGQDAVSARPSIELRDHRVRVGHQDRAPPQGWS